MLNISPVSTEVEFVDELTGSIASMDRDKPKKVITEFSNDPLSVFYVQSLMNIILELPNGEKGYEEIDKAITSIKENIRGRDFGPKIILEWDAATTALSSMTMKDMLKAINSIIFVHFPDIHSKISILLTQWLKIQKMPSKS